MAERLDKFLAENAGMTRKEAKVVLNKGRVTVNGVACKNGDAKVSAEDRVCLDGKELCAGEEFLYLLLHKPAGVVSATEDAKDKTVLDVIREQLALHPELNLTKRELFPVGRLDKDTEGLLLLTDDGELAHRLLSPKRHVDKVYYARLSGIVPEDAPDRFLKGLPVGKEYVAMPAKLEILSVSPEENRSEVQITLKEGKFHQVKRMCHEIGCEVTYLKRLSMGSLVLEDDLPCGEFRVLTQEEILELKK